MTPMDAKLRLIEAGLVLEAYGHADFTRGHISVRVPGDPSKFFMKPHSHGFDEMTPENIVTCNLEGEKIDGGGPRHSEVYIHSEIFKLRPDVQSVIHSHSVHCVAVSATGRPLRMLSQPSAVFLDGVPYYTDTIDLIRTHAMGHGVAKALGPHKACFMKNHGVAVAGASIEESVYFALMLENAAQVQILAEAAGGVAPEFPHDDIKRLQDKLTRPEQIVVNFNYLVRKLKRKGG